MKESTNITINGNVTINSGCEGIGERQPIDRTNEILIDNSTSFAELMDILSSRPEANSAAEFEAEEKAKEEEEERLRRKYGPDYEYVVGSGNSGERPSMEKAARRPGPVQLRTYIPMIARIKVGPDGVCEVFANGYAIYDNGNRKTVVWVPDCGSATYYFGALKDREKEYQKQKDEVGEDVLGTAPWYNAVLIAGEDSIQFNMDHPKSKGTASDSEDPEEWEKKGNYRWSCGTHFESPEEAYIRKEAALERRRALTEKQKEAYILYYEEGYTMEQIAEICGVDWTTIRERLNAAKKIYGKDREKYFFA